jgi:LPS export ABC transporter protein LptC
MKPTYSKAIVVLWPFAFIPTCLPWLLLLLLACSQPHSGPPLVYEGPMREADSVELLYTENLILKIKLQAPKVLEFQNGDREFPEGIYIEFFNEYGQLTSTLRANQARYFKTEDQWRARGKVELINLEKNEQLNTEELFWKPAKEEIFTESFVSIKMQNEVLYGEGLRAKQDMSDYTILRPQGEFVLTE